MNKNIQFPFTFHSSLIKKIILIVFFLLVNNTLFDSSHLDCVHAGCSNPPFFPEEITLETPITATSENSIADDESNITLIGAGEDRDYYDCFLTMVQGYQNDNTEDDISCSIDESSARDSRVSATINSADTGDPVNGSTTCAGTCMRWRTKQ